MLRGQVGRLRLPHGIPINNLNQETTIHCITSFRYNLVPKKVHACTTRGPCMYFFLTITLFNVNVDADVNNLRRVSIAEQVNVIVSVNVDFSRSLVNVIVIVNVLGELRFAKILKYQPHLIAGEVA